MTTYIHIDEKRISRQHSIPYRVRFELNSANLKNLDLARKNGEVIAIPQDILTNLRYYALLAYKANGGSFKDYFLPSQLVFTTNYLQQENSVSVVRSALSLRFGSADNAPEGKISQQIHRELWENSDLLPKILKIHHWSIAQMLSQLSLKTQNYTSYLSFGISLIFTGLVALLIFNFLSLSYLLGIALIIISLIFSEQIIQYLLRYKLKIWILDRLLWGFLGSSLRKRRLAFQILSILG